MPFDHNVPTAVQIYFQFKICHSHPERFRTYDFLFFLQHDDSKETWKYGRDLATRLTQMGFMHSTDNIVKCPFCNFIYEISLFQISQKTLSVYLLEIDNSHKEESRNCFSHTLGEIKYAHPPYPRYMRKVCDELIAEPRVFYSRLWEDQNFVEYDPKTFRECFPERFRDSDLL